MNSEKVPIHSSLLPFTSNMVDIAQLVSASDCGSEGRGFESHYPPHKKNRYLSVSVLFIWADMGFEEAAPTTQNENILPEYALKYARQDQYGRSALRLLILAAFPSKGKKLWNNHIKTLFVVIRKNSFAQISTTVRRSFSISFCKALFIYFTIPNEHFTKPCFRILHRDSMMKP